MKEMECSECHSRNNSESVGGPIDNVGMIVERTCTDCGHKAPVGWYPIVKEQPDSDEFAKLMREFVPLF